MGVLRDIGRRIEWVFRGGRPCLVSLRLEMRGEVVGCAVIMSSCAEEPAYLNITTKGKGWQRACPKQNGYGNGKRAAHPSIPLMERSIQGGEGMWHGHLKRVSHRHLD